MAFPGNAVSGPYILYPQGNMAVPPHPMATPTAAQTSAFYQALQKGQMKALGTTHIVLALLEIALGTVLIFTTIEFVTISVYSGINFWGAVFYIISGSLSVAAENKQSRCLVRGSVAMNVISSIISFAALGLFITDTLLYNCYSYCNSQYCNCSYTVW
ncbi:membrane-spanning 4-domains subfamily A member 8-like, partial [Ascaphus truei]|uniref:membrane-spanning 4-domains subfamily A member 8-like n=1 Tax=Ascaphus truei TaxID=8439 RepID=UPI003F5AD4F0